MKIDSTVKYAQHKLDEAIKHGDPDHVVQYWRGYLDCAKSIENDLEEKDHGKENAW